MSFAIQRVPRGLSDILSIFGGHTPRDLSSEVHGSLELMQLYGQTQLTTATATNAALAEGTDIQIVPAAQWTVVFSATINIVKTATMTALGGAISVIRGTPARSFLAASTNLGPFGATETGNAILTWVAPYPFLCQPNTAWRFFMPVLGTDATASVTCTVEFGTLG